MTDIAGTLVERGTRYGRFDDHAAIVQDLKREMQKQPGWQRLAPDQKEALDMIAHKIGRVLAGDPDYADSWHDIAGYAKLVDDRLQGVDSNRKPHRVASAIPPAVKTWHAVPVNEFGVPLPDLQEPLSFGGTD